MSARRVASGRQRVLSNSPRLSRVSPVRVPRIPSMNRNYVDGDRTGIGKARRTSSRTLRCLRARSGSDSTPSTGGTISFSSGRDQRQDLRRACGSSSGARPRGRNPALAGGRASFPRTPGDKSGLMRRSGPIPRLPGCREQSSLFRGRRFAGMAKGAGVAPVEAESEILDELAETSRSVRTSLVAGARDLDRRPLKEKSEGRDRHRGFSRHFDGRSVGS